MIAVWERIIPSRIFHGLRGRSARGLTRGVKCFLTRAFVLPLITFFASACSGAGYESATSTVANAFQIQSALDTVNVLLSTKNCFGAVSTIYSLYNSANSNNQIRMAAASAYGCSSKIDLFLVMNDLVSSNRDLAGSGFFEFLAVEFASVASPDDKVPQSAEFGIDAVFATLKPGTILATATTVNSTSYNPGSIIVADRLDDANAYLTFLSMALMGSLQSRNGAVLSNGHKGQDLPWSSATETKGDGCAYASAVLNFIDGLNFLQSQAPSSAAAQFTKIANFFNAGLDQACSFGCTLCGGSVSCTSCPRSLRDRSSCTGLATDTNSCAAAGIAYFVNQVWTGPP